MSIRNNSGKYTTPGLRGITAAAATVKSVPATGELHIVNPPKGDPLAYPICTFTYVIVPAKTSRRPSCGSSSSTRSTRRRARSSAPKLLFAPLPKVVLVASEKTLKKVQS